MEQKKVLPKQQNPGSKQRKARAPYNFVPLPGDIVSVELPPDQDIYHEKAGWFTGYITCRLSTLTPLYTRCMMNSDFFKNYGESLFSDLNPDDKTERAQFFHLDEIEHPVIPSSSLRGMTRALVEIVGYGKIPWVTDQDKMFYRAVAAAKSDPLAQPYRNALGRFGRNVKAGYIFKEDGQWRIQPALSPRDIGLKSQDTYIKVKERQIKRGALPGFIGLNDADYVPQYHDVSFVAQTRKGKRGEYISVTEIGHAEAGHSNRGVLVCSGNMLETDSMNRKSPRKNHALVLPKNDKAKSLKINQKAVDDYQVTLTDFEKQSPPFDELEGCLIEGRPVFYVEAGNEVFLFGHCPNFRVPMHLAGEKRAATPLDFVPHHLRNENDTDLAEAIFGYVKGDEVDMGKARACAGRVFFTDAQFKAAEDGLWLASQPITPRVLGGPKPTTFQHYLTQQNPDSPSELSHYGSPTPTETVIRGHKLYWHKDGELTLADIEETDQEKLSKSPKQYTRIKPVKDKVDFKFEIHFENLSQIELGVLLWVLDLPEKHHHKLGMGKPLGMGSVKIEPQLVLSNRQTRYSQLFDDEAKWITGERSEEDFEHFKQAFEMFMLAQIPPNERKERFAEVDRITMLLEMLRWPGPDRDQTRYMTIQPDNEFKSRPVLPDPLSVGKNRPQLSHSAGTVETLKEGTEEKPASKASYAINFEFAVKITTAWDKKLGGAEIEMPNGEKGILKVSRKKIGRLQGQRVKLVVIGIKNGIYHLSLS